MSLRIQIDLGRAPGLLIVIVEELGDLSAQFDRVVGLLGGCILEDGALGVARQGASHADHRGAQAFEDMPLTLLQPADLIARCERLAGRRRAPAGASRARSFVIAHGAPPLFSRLTPPWR